MARQLYCSCRRPDDGKLMVECERCLEWFHATCVGLKRRPSSKANWYCPTCRLSSGQHTDAIPTQQPSTSIAMDHDNHVQLDISQGIAILSLNCDSSLETLRSLKSIIKTEKPLAFCLQDICLMKHDDLETTFSEIAPQHRSFIGSAVGTNQNGLVKIDTAILLREDVSGSPISNFDEGLIRSNIRHSILGVMIQVTTSSSKKFLYPLYSVYIRPFGSPVMARLDKDNEKESENDYSKMNCILSYIERSSSNVATKHRRIVMGDFNAVSPLWTPFRSIKGTHSVNATFKAGRLKRGRRLASFVDRLRLVCLNDLSKGPTFIRGDQSSHLDLTLVGAATVRRYKSFDLIKPGGKTKHMITKIDQKRADSNKKSEYYKMSSMNDRMFRKFRCSYEYKAYRWNQEGPEKILESMNILADELYKTLIFVQHRIRRTYTQQDQRLNSRDTKVYRLLQKLKRFKRMRADLRRKTYLLKTPVVMKLRSRSQKMVSNLSKILRKSIDKHAQETEGSSTKLPNLTPALLARIARDKFPHYKRSDEPLNRLCKSSLEISDSEVSLGVQSIANKKALDHYGLSYSILAHSYKFIPIIINAICKMSFFLGQLPQTKLMTLGKLIPKKEEGEFRVLHISSALMALLESIALPRLQYLIESKRLETSNQFGFKKDVDRNDFVAKVVEFVYRSRVDNLGYRRSCTVSTLVQLDIEAAFDSLGHDSLANIVLDKLGDEAITTWLVRFVYNRRIILNQIKHEPNQTTTFKKVCRGIPQGSCLSPILWNLATLDLLSSHLIRVGQLELIAYADDLLILHHGSSTIEGVAFNNLYLLIQELVEKLSKLKLRFNANKSRVTCKKGIGPSHRPKVMVCGVELEYEEKLKLLGMPLGVRFKPHCSDLLSCMTEKMNINARKLYSHARLKTTYNPKEWQTLILQYLINSTASSFTTILAIHEAGRRACDGLISRTLRQIFSFAPGVKSEFLYLLADYPSCNLLIHRWLEQRQVTCRSDLRSAYTVVMHLFCGSIREIEPFYWKSQELSVVDHRRYTSPDCFLSKIKLFSAHGYKRWMIVTSAYTACGILINQSERFPKRIIKVSHQTFSCGHSDQISLLYVLVADDTINPNERFIHLSEQSSVLALLENYRTHDSDVITLRERLNENGWTVLTSPNEQFNDAKLTLFKRYEQAIDEWPTFISDIPDYSIKLRLRAINFNYKEEQARYFSNCMSQIMKKIEPNFNIWQSISINFIDSILIYNLYGRLPHQEFVKTECEINQLPLGCNLDDDCAGRNKLGDLILHRMFECPRFNTTRKGLFKSEKLDDQVAKDMLKHPYKRVTLFKFIKLCARNNVNISLSVIDGDE